MATGKSRKPSKSKQSLLQQAKSTKSAKIAITGDAEKVTTARVAIPAPNMQHAIIKIRGTAPYVQNAFSEKARNAIMQTQAEGSRSRKGKVREPKDFKQCYLDAMHRDKRGRWGIPCAAFRAGAISGCRTVGFKMTHAKLGLSVVADTFDAKSGDPLVLITKGKPIMDVRPARPSMGGMDIRARPMWLPGWEANVHVRWDADMFSATDIVNLISRIGLQVGIGEGRNDSRDSAGVGWGHFEVVR